MDIPKQLQRDEFRFILVSEKSPIEKEWTTKNNYRFDDEKIKNYPKNLGIVCGFGGLAILDCDDAELKTVADAELPETFEVKTGSGGCHKYYFIPDLDKKIIFQKGETHFGELQTTNTQCVLPGSVHPNGNKYIITNDVDIATITKNDLVSKLFRFMNPKDLEKQYVKKNNNYDNYSGLVEEIKRKITMPELMSEYGYDLSKNPTICKLGHDTKGRGSFSFNNELFNCFHCSKSGDIFSFVMEHKNSDFKQALTLLREKAGIPSEKTEKKLAQEVGNSYNKIAIAKKIMSIIPMYYDISKIWFIWNEEQKKYERHDETDILNIVRNAITGVSTTNSHEKSEILESLRQVSREQKPKPKPKGWMQFKDTLINPRTGETQPATSEYLLLNPIPHNIGKSTETPNIDRLFEDWVVSKDTNVKQDKTYIQTLKEVSAYALTDDLFMHRMFPLTGGGCNGKGTYISFLINLIGAENTVSVDLKKICTDKFALSQTYGKLLGVTGEMSSGDLTNTNQIKRLTGEDKIEYEFKGKDSFTDDNRTTFFLPTNSLPPTPDKSLGFYRRTLIIDFPNTFEIKPNLLDDIPEEEYENFCRKCVQILGELYKTNKFTNEGTNVEREQRYNERAEPINVFIEQFCEEIGHIPIKEFCEVLNDWLQSKHFPKKTVTKVGKEIRAIGYEVSTRKKNEVNSKCVIGLSLKNHQNHQNHQKTNQNAYGILSAKVGGLGGFSGFLASETSKTNKTEGVFNIKFEEETLFDENQSGGFAVTTDKVNNSSNSDGVLDIIKGFQEQNNKQPIDFLELESLSGLDSQVLSQSMAKLKSQGLIYEPKSGFWGCL